MAANEIAVARMALGMLGITGQSSVMQGATTVAGLASSDSEADVQIQLWYQTAVNAMLKAPWPDFTMGVALAIDETSDGSQTWTFQWPATYAYPASCFAVLGILDRGRLSKHIKFWVSLNDAGTKVVFVDAVADTVNAQIVTTDATDITLWSANMDLAAAAYLASFLAMPLKADPQLEITKRQLATMQLAGAWAASGLEREPDQNVPSRYERARLGQPNPDDI